MKRDRFNWYWPALSVRAQSPRAPDIDEIWEERTAVQATPTERPSTRRVLIVAVLPLCVMFGLLARLAFLQLRQSDAYRQLVDRNQYRYVEVPAPRGAILDRNGVTMVDNAPNYVLTVIPASVPTKKAPREAFLANITRVTGMAAGDIEKKLTNKKYSQSDAVPVLDHIPFARALQYAVSFDDVTGVNVTAYPTRSYIYGEADAPVIGYIGAVTDKELRTYSYLTKDDEIGKTGVELTYNQALTGTPGFIAYERTGKNEFLSSTRHRDPVPGKTLHLTIDQELQRRLYEAVVEQVQKAHSSGGAAVALDPRNGDILGLVSVPTYDSNWFIQPDLRSKATDAVTNPKRLMLNRAISGQYPSGSIIKPIISAAALAEHVITPQTIVMSVGGFKVGPNFFPDWKAGGHGATNVLKAIAESVNTFFYAIGGGHEDQVGLGVERIVTYLAKFGWGRELGVDLPNEADGFLPIKTWRETQRATPWRLGDTYHLSIGQGDLEVTPLQVAASTVAIANGGTLYAPRVVSEITDADGAVVQTIAPKVIADHLVSSNVLSTVRAGMREGVLTGSSRSLLDLPITAAAKTGTAQYGNQGKTHAWFSAFAPYEDPKIVIAVIIEGGGEGHASALPVAKEVLQWYATRLSATH